MIYKNLASQHAALRKLTIMQIIKIQQLSMIYKNPATQHDILRKLTLSK